MTTLAAKPDALSNGSRVKSRKGPRLGFLGVGWIGRHRLEAIARSDVAEIAGIADLSDELVNQARNLAPKAEAANSLQDLLAMELDGVVIATPSALHAEQSLEALNAGCAVFCQKPLGRTAPEVQQVIAAAQAKDLLLGVDLSYRFISGIRAIRELCRGGELGDIFAADLVFHNAYGPDKTWFYERRSSGGGCLLDLGIHLLDLGLWCFDFPEVAGTTARMFRQGRPLGVGENEVEDYAVGRIDLANGATIQLACSWKLPAGCDAVISGSFYGTKGGAAFHNVGGSFYDFKAERFEGTRPFVLADAKEEWGGRAAVDWASRLAKGEGFSTEMEKLSVVAETLDALYAATLDGSRAWKSGGGSLA